jgi:hypothetical protein
VGEGVWFLLWGLLNALGRQVFCGSLPELLILAVTFTIHESMYCPISIVTHAWPLGVWWCKGKGPSSVELIPFWLILNVFGEGNLMELLCL